MRVISIIAHFQKCQQSAYEEHFVSFFGFFSFTDFPLIKLPPETNFIFKEAPNVAPGHNIGYSYAHANIAQIKNAKKHCVHVTEHSGWRFSTTHVMKYLHGN